MTGRDNRLWLQFWKDRRTDFHQTAVNKLLIRFWPSVNPPPGGLVFVPLCGKSLDMLWLAKQGYRVIGVELSPIAAKAFSRKPLTGGPPPSRQIQLWQHGDISILCGDFFALLEADLGKIDMVYDRAALTALPEDIRKRYVEHLLGLIPEQVKILLLTAEDYDESSPSDGTLLVDREIDALFSSDFDINLAHAETVLELNAQSPELAAERVEYKVYRLSRRME